MVFACKNTLNIQYMYIKSSTHPGDAPWVPVSAPHEPDVVAYTLGIQFWGGGNRRVRKSSPSSLCGGLEENGLHGLICQMLGP